MPLSMGMGSLVGAVSASTDTERSTLAAFPHRCIIPRQAVHRQQGRRPFRIAFSTACMKVQHATQHGHGKPC